jgi:predicted acetyltransferase
LAISICAALPKAHVLVKRGSEVSNLEAVWDMAEFFVIRGYRRRGVGIAVAHQLWRRFPGIWEVRVMESNHSAHPFWTRAVSTFTNESLSPVRIQKGDKYWHLFSFESKRVPQQVRQDGDTSMKVP